MREVLKGRYVYTPQVVLNGRDERQWSGYAAGRLAQVAGATPSAPPTLTLQRTGHEVTATVAPPRPAGTGGLLGGCARWLEQPVTRGENAGETLQHDHVVSLYQPVASWAADQPKTVQLNLPQGPELRCPAGGLCGHPARPGASGSGTEPALPGMNRLSAHREQPRHRALNDQDQGPGTPRLRAAPII
ncbi:MAG: DUF1223 domain-containing protein [Burkholderiaceae bacterium]